jgi:hypothetical protein
MPCPRAYGRNMAEVPAENGFLDEDGESGLAANDFELGLREAPHPEGDPQREAERLFFIRSAAVVVGVLLTAGIAWGLGAGSTTIQIAAVLGGIAALALTALD